MVDYVSLSFHSPTCYSVVRAEEDRVLLDEAARGDAVEPVRPFVRADVAEVAVVAGVLEEEEVDHMRVPPGTDGHRVGLDEALLGPLGQSGVGVDPLREDVLRHTIFSAIG